MKETVIPENNSPNEQGFFATHAKVMQRISERVQAKPNDIKEAFLLIQFVHKYLLVLHKNMSGEAVLSIIDDSAKEDTLTDNGDLLKRNLVIFKNDTVSFTVKDRGNFLSPIFRKRISLDVPKYFYLLLDYQTDSEGLFCYTDRNSSARSRLYDINYMPKQIKNETGRASKAAYFVLKEAEYVCDVPRPISLATTL